MKFRYLAPLAAVAVLSAPAFAATAVKAKPAANKTVHHKHVKAEKKHETKTTNPAY